MVYHLSRNKRSIKGIIEIGGSKSESNRLLMLREYSGDFKITNLSKSDDTKTLVNALANTCLLYTSPSPRDRTRSRMPSSA